MRLKPFQLPERPTVDAETLTPSYGRFTVTPLERGWGHTIGNALRRALLSSVQGAAVTQLRIDGVLHEFSTIPGVLEDVPEIVLALKRVILRLDSEEPKLGHLAAKGKGEVTAQQIEFPPEVTVLNPEHKLFTITDSKRVVNLELRVENGRGYVPAERLKKNQPAPAGTIFLDAFFSPVKLVRYTVESTRVRDRADFERIILEVTTNGTVRPEDCVIQSATLLKEHMLPVLALGQEPEFIKETKLDKEEERLRELLGQDIENLEISYRAYNCLRNGRLKSTNEPVNIRTIGDLVARSEKEMLDIENFGRKSLQEIKAVLENLGLSFGMDVTKLTERSAE